MRQEWLPTSGVFVRFCCAVLVFSSWCGVGGGGFTATERGSRIYNEGAGVGDPIDATLNDGQLVLPATMLPCGGCHGLDGRGGSEGGVGVPDIRWSALSRSMSISGGMTRTRPPYDEDSLRRAITMGWDSAGNELHRAMPRYRLSSEDAEDLIAHLKTFDARDPDGVRGNELVIATLSPPASQTDRVTRYEAYLRNAWDEFNASGGVFGRTVKFIAVPAGASSEESTAALRNLLDREKPLALVAPFFAGGEQEFISVTEQAGVPVVAPIAYAPHDAERLTHRTFWILPGQHHAIEVLMRQAATHTESSEAPIALLLPQNPRVRREMLPDEEIARMVRERMAAEGRSVQLMRFGAGAHDAAAVVAGVRSSRASSALILGDQLEVEALLQEFRQLGQRIDLFVLSSSTAARLLQSPERFDRHPAGIFVALPALGDFRDDAVRAALGGVLEQTAQLGVALLMEGLKRAGEQVDRDRLVAALESLSGFTRDPFPEVRYGPGRRSGVQGALLFRLGMQEDGEPATRWVSLDGN